MLLSSNKNKRKSSLTIAIIIISLSLLPLNDDLGPDSDGFKANIISCEAKVNLN
jgi:hypothetical protein